MKKTLTKTLLGVAMTGLLTSVSAPAMAEGRWIAHSSAIGEDAGKQQVSLQLRRSFDLEAVPGRLEVSVSADNRYILYVNGERVDAGPSRGDLANWRYRQIDISPWLKAGTNHIAAQVWNDGKAKGVPQISDRTGFWLEAADPAFSFLDSSPEWQVRLDGARTVTPSQPAMYHAVGPKYFASPPPETFAADAQLEGWATGAGSDWASAAPVLANGEAAPWTLIADRLPQMRYQAIDGGEVARVWGIDGGGDFPSAPLTIPAHKYAAIRLDMGAMRAAYPRLVTSGGAGAEIEIVYAEAPYGDERNYLEDRGAAKDGAILGLTDTFLPAGDKDEVFETFWWRAWRYAELRVKTGDEPVVLESFTRMATGYPFQTVGSFESEDEALEKIWQIGWDTVQLDGHETYMDTAYWEQLQYVGDTRIQALVSYAVSGDARLAEQAVEAYAASTRDGLIQSRYPANLFQSIPPFALLWVGMLHDYWMYRPDPAPVARVLPQMRSSLAWYADYVEEDGLVGTTKGWEFIDWREGLDNFDRTVDPADTERCIISLMYLGALQQAGDLEEALGDPAMAADYRSRSGPLAQAIRDLCWSSERGIFADQPAKTSFSQHANVLAVIYDVAPADQQQEILRRVLVDGDWPAAPEGVTPATYYFDFYLARALQHAGMGNEYLQILAPWRQMLAQNFSTWPEAPDPSRSDSHAWSAHPTFDLMTIVAGIQPGEPGFGTVKIAPHLNGLEDFSVRYAHPAGPIDVAYDSDGEGTSARIVLPDGLSGTFEHGGFTRALTPGENSFTF